MKVYRCTGYGCDSCRSAARSEGREMICIAIETEPDFWKRTIHCLPCAGELRNRLTAMLER